MALQSEIFRTPPAPYARIEARRYYKTIGFPALLIVGILALLSVSDFRFAVVALMIVCVVIPMFLLLAWLKLTGSRQMQLHLRPQRWTRISTGELLVEFFPFSVEENPDTEPLCKVTINVSNIEAIETAGKYQVLFLVKPFPESHRFFIIPQNIIQQNPSLLLNL